MADSFRSYQELLEGAREVAAATQSPVLLGVRPHTDAVFANCDGVESDGSTFFDALEGVVIGLEQRASSQLAEARKTQQKAEKVMGLRESLGGTSSE